MAEIKYRVGSVDINLYQHEEDNERVVHVKQKLVRNGIFTSTGEEKYLLEDGVVYLQWTGDDRSYAPLNKIIKLPGGGEKKLYVMMKYDDYKFENWSQKYKITADNVALREGPDDEKFETIKTLSKGGAYSTVERTGDWYLHVNGGWAHLTSENSEIWVDEQEETKVVYKCIVDGNRLMTTRNDEDQYYTETTLVNGGLFTAKTVVGDWAEWINGGWARIYGPDGEVRMILVSGDPGFIVDTDYTYIDDIVGTVASDGSIGLTADEINFMIKKSLWSKGIYTGKELYDNRFTKFSRIPLLDTYPTGSNYEYIFFTKPDLHIFKDKNGTGNVLNPELSQNPVFASALKTHKPVLQSLQYSTDRCPFIPLLTNQIKSAVDLPGLSADDIETSQNRNGIGITYRKSSVRSDQDFEFNVEFRDTLALDVYMWFKLFDEYEKLKYVGEITPPDEWYRTYKILHDQFSVYKFIVSEDRQTLLYWAKLYGVYPKGAPRDSFSDMTNDGITFSVPFKAQWVDDMDPLILSDFNYTVKQWKDTTTIPLMSWFNEEMQGFDGSWAELPYITYTGNGYVKGQVSYELVWRGNPVNISENGTVINE